MNDTCLFAVFPLPRIVAFPGHTLQFHIFEPRYRRMVCDCIDNNILLGVAQGQAVKKLKSLSLKSGEKFAEQSAEQFLNSNQENYSAASIFGAGPLTIIKEFPDGRFIVEVRVEARVEIDEIVQNVPYLQVRGTLLKDDPLEMDVELDAVKQVLDVSRQLLGKRANLFHELAGFDDHHKGLSDLVYSVLKWFVVEPEEGQRILEKSSALERSQILLAWMLYFLSRTEINQVQAESKSADPKGARVIAVDFHHKDPEDENPDESKSL